MVPFPDLKGDMKMKSKIKTTAAIAFIAIAACILLVSGTALADNHTGQSVNVAIIGSPVVVNGGVLPTAGPVGELGDFSFTNLHPANVNAVNLTPFDTVVLNVASVEMGETTATLSATAKADLVTFVAGGGKLIIYDSESPTVDYSWLPYPFTTSNPGALGQTGTLTIVEENTLSTSDPNDVHFINATALGTQTDAVGDMNVMTTFDPNWCIDMSGTNANQVTGPVHAYAKYPAGTDTGLIIYNGLDVDYLGSGFDPADGLRKIWVQELQQPFNPSNLPCGFTVVGITLEPESDVNEVGQEHTVIATLTDLLGEPQAGIEVEFNVTSGPNAGELGSNTTDANGIATFTYTGDGGLGTDTIKAGFINEAGDQVCSQVVTKEWVDETAPEVWCIETVNPAGKNVPPAGSTTLPGPKGGQNEDGFYELNARDNFDLNPEIWVVDSETGVTFGPFASGTKIKYTEANGAEPSIKEMTSAKSKADAVDWQIKGQGDMILMAIDSSGNVGSCDCCLVPPLPK
jgi:hypothetical protein